MTDLPGLELVLDDGGRKTWLSSEWRSELMRGLPRPMAAEGEVIASSGRGPLVRLTLSDGRTALVRTYRRGGALRALLPDAFLSARRARAEVRALARLSETGLAPRVVALEVRGRFLKRIRIAALEIPGTVDLLRLAREDPACGPDARLGRAVGEAVAAVHDAGVGHPDLNLGNVLVSPGDGGSNPRVHLVDFDGARCYDGPVPMKRRVRDVLRLCRSLDKWAVSTGASAAVRAAFLRAALPRGDRLAALRRGRRLHRLRKLLGRTGRR